jgi:hypothetical protein
MLLLWHGIHWVKSWYEDVMGSYPYLLQQAVGGNLLKNHCAFQSLLVRQQLSIILPVLFKAPIVEWACHSRCLTSVKRVIWLVTLSFPSKWRQAVKDHCVLFLESSVSKDWKLWSVMTQKIHRYWRDTQK